MEDLKKYTPTELLKILNDTKLEHEIIKSKIVEFTNEVDILEEKINLELILLSETEKKYIELIEEINSR